MSTIHRQGELRGDKVAYPDGVGCSIWYPLGVRTEDEDIGICFDFPAEDIDDLIALLQKMKDAPADEG